MVMNVQPVATASERVNEIRALTAEIVNREILPNENLLWASRTNPSVTDGDRAAFEELRAGIVAKVKQAGLWAPHLPAEYGGAGLDFLELAYMYEVLVCTRSSPTPWARQRCSVSSHRTRVIRPCW